MNNWRDIAKEFGFIFPHDFPSEFTSYKAVESMAEEIVRLRTVLVIEETENQALRTFYEELKAERLYSSKLREALHDINVGPGHSECQSARCAQLSAKALAIPRPGGEK